MAAIELDTQTSWQQMGDEEWRQRRGLRSRYSGYPLKNDKMVITILSQGSFSAGHQAISFEWADHSNKHAEGSYRKHKTFHLYPAEGQSARPEELGLVGSSTSVVPGRIERLRNFSRNDEGVAKSIDKHEIGSKKEAENIFLEKNGRYRSWEVDMNDGQKAFQAAKAQWKTADALPNFNLLGGGGGDELWHVGAVDRFGRRNSKYILHGINRVPHPHQRSLIGWCHKIRIRDVGFQARITIRVITPATRWIEIQQGCLAAIGFLPHRRG